MDYNGNIDYVGSVYVDFDTDTLLDEVQNLFGERNKILLNLCKLETFRQVMEENKPLTTSTDISVSFGLFNNEEASEENTLTLSFSNRDEKFVKIIYNKLLKEIKEYKESLAIIEKEIRQHIKK